MANIGIQELLEKRAGILDNQEKLLISAKQSGTMLTKDQLEQNDKWIQEVDEIERTIEATEAFNKKVTSNDLLGAKETSFEANSKKESEIGLGAFCQSVAKYSNTRVMDDNLKTVLNAASGHSANVPSDGGFLVSPTQSNEIMRRMYEDGEVLSQCAVLNVGQGSDSFEVPYIDETSRANGSRWGGLRVYREGEVDTPTSTKTKIGKWECRVSDLKALVYVTDRLLEDATALESLINEQIDQEFTFKLEDEILRGEGGASCKGIIADPATVSVAKETGQAADTILYENVIKMWARMWGKSRKSAKWYVNQDCEPELYSMALNVGTGGVPVFLPPGGLSDKPYSKLMTRDVVTIEQCSTVGDVGDIILADFSQYAIVKKGAMKEASSIHVKFLTNETTFRFLMRVNGKPKWKSALTPYKGANTLSPFVTLANRA